MTVLCQCWGRAGLKCKLSGNTDSGKGLAKAYDVLKGIAGTGERVFVNDGRRKMVLFMTDGVPASSAGRFNPTIANNAIVQADKIKNMDGDESTVIYSVGIFDSADSNGTIYNGSVNDIDQYMASVATNQDYYMNADSLDTIGDVFESIGQTMGRTVTADVTDVIDARFELAEGERERLINNTGAEITENADLFQQLHGQTQVSRRQKAINLDGKDNTCQS